MHNDKLKILQKDKQLGNKEPTILARHDSSLFDSKQKEVTTNDYLFTIDSILTWD